MRRISLINSVLIFNMVLHYTKIIEKEKIEKANFSYSKSALKN